jgi:hypothetical protein
MRVRMDEIVKKINERKAKAKAKPGEKVGKISQNKLG